MSSSDMTLMREMTCSATAMPLTEAIVHQDAVDAVADGESGGGRLQVNVARPGCAEHRERVECTRRTTGSRLR